MKFINMRNNLTKELTQSKAYGTISLRLRNKAQYYHGGEHTGSDDDMNEVINNLDDDIEALQREGLIK